MTKKYTQRWLAVLSIAIATLASAAWGDDAGDVSKLIQQGHLPEAMQKADAFLSQHPKDAQVRFLKGLIFAEQNKPNDAITVFTKLTEDYPKLPEPYNNLAVLYASTNQYDKARAALEMAIRTNPSYGTAHENLGDVYAKLASQSYGKALQLDSANSGAKLKLTLIRNLFTNTNGAVTTNTVNAKSPASPATQVAIASPVTANNASTSSKTKSDSALTPSAPIASNNFATLTKQVATKQETAKPEPAKVEPTKSAAIKSDLKAIANTAEHEDILKIVDAWAAAWSEKNTSTYLAFYGKDFQLPKGTTRKSWSEERRVRIESKGRIHVKISSPKVNVDSHTATVKFRQIYNSDRFKADSRKTLVLNKQGGKWQITQERAGG